MNDSAKMRALAVDLLRWHGPLTMGELLRLLPRQWDDHITPHGGKWLGAQLRRDDRVERDPETQAWRHKEGTCGN